MVKDPSRETAARPQTITAVSLDPTTGASMGFDVSDLSSVAITVHPINPDMAAVPAGFAGEFRLWRYYGKALAGQNIGSGQWYSENPVTLTFDGTGVMEITAPTLNCTQMYLQCVSVIAEPVTWSLCITPYKLVRRREDNSDTVTAIVPSIPASGTLAVEGLTAVIPNSRYLWSTDNNSIWEATQVSATTLNLHDVATNAIFPAIVARQIIAIVEYTPLGSSVYYTRLNGNRFSYVPATGVLGCGEAAFDNKSTFVVYWEDVERGVGTHGDAPFADNAGEIYLDHNGATARSSDPAAVDNADMVALIADLTGKLITAGYTWASDSNREEEVDPLNEKYLSESLIDTTNLATGTTYYPSSNGQAMGGYKDLSYTGKLVDADGILTLTMQATNDEDLAAADWVNISASGYRSDLHAYATPPTVTDGTLIFGWDFDNINYRYVRLAVTATPDAAATSTIVVKQRRKAL